MDTIRHYIANQLERLCIPRLAQWTTALQTKIRHYQHEQLKLQLKFCGMRVRFKRDLQIEHPQQISLGNNVYLGPDVYLDGRGGITIGDHTTLGCNVTVLSANHDYQGNALPYEHDVYIHKPVTIGSNVWIGANVLIVPGIIIGEGAIVAAGTVVTSNVAPLAIVGSQPMRTLKYRDRDHYERLAQAQSPTIAP
jgi:maltose O-acetyltransferase